MDRSAADSSATRSQSGIDELLTAKFTLGDDLRYAQPGYDDSDWQSVEMPHSWAREAVGSIGQTGWYRFRIRPEIFDRFATEEVRAAFSTGVPGNVCEVFCNGRRIGGHEDFASTLHLPRTSTMFVVSLGHAFANSVAPLTEEIVLAVRIRCFWGDGGMLGLPPALGDFAHLQLRKRNFERYQMLAQTATLTLTGIIALSSMGLCLAGWRNALVFSTAVIFISDFAYQLIRTTTLLATESSVPAWILFAVVLLQYAFAPVAMIVLLARLHGRSLSARVRHGTRWSLIFLVSAVSASCLPSTQTTAVTLIAIWLLGFVAWYFHLMWRSIRARHPGACIISSVVVVVLALGLYDAALYIVAIADTPLRWIDPWSIAFAAGGGVLAGVIGKQLIGQRRLTRELADRLSHAEMLERSRVARELHDGINQDILALKLNVEASASDMDRLRLANELDRISESVRRVAHALHGEHLSGEPLPTAFAIIAASFGPGRIEFVDESKSGDEVGAAEVRQRVPKSGPVCDETSPTQKQQGTVEQICPSPAVHHEMQKIFQELAANAVQHGAIEQTIQALWQRSNGFCRLVFRNGTRDPSAEREPAPIAKRHRPGIGLRNVEERVRLLGGTLNVQHRPQARQFEVVVTIPLPALQRDRDA